MFTKRDFTGPLIYLIDLLLPPIVRDSFVFKYLFGSKFKFGSDMFKKDIIDSTPEELKKYYISDSYIKRPTDITKKALKKIMFFISESNLLNPKICDVGGGNLFLAKKIIKDFNYTTDVIDFLIEDDENIKRIEYNLEKKLDFIEDNYYEICISTHTVEHLLNSSSFVNEIRRISNYGFVLLFPKQRPYKYTPDTHINFYPYIFEVEKLVGKIDGNKKMLVDLRYDWLYLEKLS